MLNMQPGSRLAKVASMKMSNDPLRITVCFYCSLFFFDILVSGA